MDLYLIRHADALALGTGGITDDAERPLSEEGKAQARLLATGLRGQGVRLEKVVTSPLVRARQTAEELVRQWPPPAPVVEICAELSPGGKPRKLARFLRDLGGEAVAVVGHQPDLGYLASWLIGSRKAQLDFAKGGVAYLAFDGGPGKGSGCLRWLVTPRWLGPAANP